MEKRFDLEQFIKSIEIRVKDLNTYMLSERRTLLAGQIMGLPNNIGDKKTYLIEEFKLQCDMFDHGFICSSQNI